MGDNQNQIQQELEKQYLENPFKPKKKVRDIKDIKYIDQKKKEEEELKKLNEQEGDTNKVPTDLNSFEPNQELKIEKEKIKRDKLPFAKQSLNMVKIGIKSAEYYLEPKENHLKWNLKDYRKYEKNKHQVSLHMQKANISFKKKKDDEDEKANESATKDENNIYFEVQYGNIQYKSDVQEGQITDPQKNPYFHNVSWTEQNYEFDTVTQTIAYFTIRKQDTHSKYKQRYNWLKEKYEGDYIIGKSKLDLASLVAPKKKNQMGKEREKEIKIKSEDTGEEIGKMIVTIQYVQPEYERKTYEKLEYNLTVTQLNVDFGKADIKQLMDKFDISGGSALGGLVPYARVRIGDQIEKTDKGAEGQKSVNSGEEYKFYINNQEPNKLYVEGYLFNEVSKFKECVGIGTYSLAKLKQIEEGSSEQKTECEIPLSYKGKLAGTASFTITLLKEEQYKEKKKNEMIDIKEISKPSEIDLKRKKILETRHEIIQQRFYELNHKKLDPERSFLTPQNTKKIVTKELKLPLLKHTQSSMLFKKPIFQPDEAELQKINLGMEYKMKPLKIQDIQDLQYKSQVYGQGFSNWESSSTLQRSVPHFSIPRQQRFLNPNNNVPAPNKYSTIGVLQQIEKLDGKLQQKRLKELEEYKALKKEMQKGF